MVFLVVATPYTLLRAEAKEVFVFLNFPPVATITGSDISPLQIPFHHFLRISSAVFHLQGERLSLRRVLRLLRFRWLSSENLRNEGKIRYAFLGGNYAGRLCRAVYYLDNGG